ncbi:class I SAM-dependent methyltransferase [Actinomadura gamaensis]|uniref:Class I SAM-dependent methyltransferase n=1 Tax=Actinomadura gamaensis TaxID=1763541 RepID=A0ABV9U9D3_9ACTN
MIYEHPLAYLLGIEGTALLRAFTGHGDRDFVEARLAEIRRLLDDPSLADAAVRVERADTVTGYGVWAPTYDDPDNAAFAIDEPVVTGILDALPPGDALDAACGTGRYARLLSARGHRVTGVDSSPAMLAEARRAVPDADFRTGSLDALPVPDASADVVTCALSLTHVPSPAPPLREFARVLRPGGHLIIADVHPDAVARGSVPTVRLDGRPARVTTHHHLVGDYLRAALDAGLHLRRCEEPVPPPPPTVPDAADGPGPWDVWPWSLAAMIPEAALAASAGVPSMLIWHFQAPTAPAGTAR